MSELNEDILNYEIGDVDADDTDLTGADEDELLLSDDESFSCRMTQDQEDDLLGVSKTAGGQQKEPQPQQSENSEVIHSEIVEKPSSVDVPPQIAKVQTKSVKNVSPTKTTLEVKACVSSESDLVTSTNRSEEDISCGSQSVRNNDDDIDSYVSSENKISESTVYFETDPSLSQSESADIKSESTLVVSSQEFADEIASDNGVQSCSEDFDLDDDDVRERRNPKTCVERETPRQLEEPNRTKNFQQHFQQRNRHNQRGGPIPRPNNPMYPMPGNSDNFNPSFMPQYRGPHRPMAPGPPGPEFMRAHGGVTMMRPPGPHRMPMHRMPPHPNRLQGPPIIGMPHQRMQRPPFQSPPGMFNPNMPPQGLMRPRIPAPNNHPMMQQGPPFGQFPPQNHSAGARHPMPANTQLPPRGTAQNINPAPVANQPQPQPLPLPIGGARKVLINPNFKGGVQAATNQLMMDTMKKSQMMETSREAELLRQQEAFINQNRMHIEKRRRSREYSPERDHRDRDRSRSFSPPRRRERDARKPYPNFRDNRARRADSKERDNFDPKRRRNEAEGNVDKNNPKTEEDEETRAYRLEIEKQKAMREKILRDKEMRRRRAAEDIKKEEDKKPATDPETLQKLTPIIVTEKKIISLKKKSDPDSTQKTKTVALVRKTVSKSDLGSAGNSNKKFRIEHNDDIDEDELLADSPPATPTVVTKTKTVLKVGEAANVPPASLFGNRRIVVRNVADTSNNENFSDKTISGPGKGIFDRLDKKVISVNETAKRKIQRIVINNSD